VIEKVRSVTDKPITHLVLTHYHAVRVLGRLRLQGRTDHHERKGPLHGSRARPGGLGFEFERFPRLFQGHESKSPA
jgi:glyoxylase-like metal-dependent hydrolase (beta-lactamase superfamily II)